MRFALTIFLSAFLLFQVQPLMGRFVLPWFGGTPAVWTTCMLLFQMLLLAGYAYAHTLASWRSRSSLVTHLALLVLSLVFLPVVPAATWKPIGSESPVGHILGLLGATVGLPYLLLSSTGPLLQSWFSRTFPGRSPFRLYALSNIGSLLALVTYPIAVEPWFRLRDQAWAWSAGYALFVLICGWTTLKMLRQPDGVNNEEASLAPASNSSAAAGSPAHDQRPAAGWSDILFWLSASACGSMLLLAITNQMCQEIAPIPFLWIVPLALYLVTFIISFDGEQWYHRAVFGVLWLVGAGATVGLLFGGPKVYYGFQLGGFALALFSGCMLCHGELVRARPPVRQLTLFYLTISAGGALGGLLVAVVAPLVFTGYWEVHVALELTSMLVCWAWFRDPNSLLHAGRPWWGWAPLASLVIVQQFLLSDNMLKSNEDVIARSRNFFGVLRVREYPVAVEDQLVLLRSLVHGNILHGVQFYDENLGDRATTYYAADSGVGLAVLNHPKRDQTPYPGIHLGIIGLGTGTASVYAQEQDKVTFYDINPDVVRFSKEYFTYRARLRPEQEQVVLGDARIQMERQLETGQPQGFDVLVVDAFSSDAIPMHLLTLESVQLYQKHLAEGGILALHVSNNHLDLVKVVRGIAAATKTPAVWIYGGNNDELQISSCSWVLLTHNEEFLGDPLVQEKVVPWEDPEVPTLLWTDDYGALWQVLK